MNVNWNKVGMYAVGGAAGAVVGIFLATFVMDVIATQKRLREIEEMDDEIVDDEKDENSEAQVLQNGWKVKSGRVNYSGQDKEDLGVLVSKYKKTSDEGHPGHDEEPTPDLYKDEPEESVTTVDRTRPYPVSWEQYTAGFGGRKSTTKIYFYTDDEVYTDEEGKVLTKPEKFLGTDVINMFGGPSGDPDIAYIRNERLKCDYHVIAINEAYESGDEDESPASRKANESERD